MEDIRQWYGSSKTNTLYSIIAIAWGLLFLNIENTKQCYVLIANQGKRIWFS